MKSHRIRDHRADVARDWIVVVVLFVTFGTVGYKLADEDPGGAFGSGSVQVVPLNRSSGTSGN